MLAVVVRFLRIELENTDSTFGSVELTTKGDADTSSPSLEAPETRFWVGELLLPMMVG